MQLPTIPTGFVERFLWHPDCPTTTTTTTIPVQSESPPPDQLIPKFPAALSQELQSVVSFAFLAASGRRRQEDVPLADQPYATPQTITFTSNAQAGGTFLIDSAVRKVAAEHHADVLVLDSLEFAAGGLGAMGEAANIVDLMYKAKEEKKEKEKGKENSSFDDDDGSDCEEDAESPTVGGDGTAACEVDKKAQLFFDALVTLGGGEHESCTLESAEAGRPKRRIIYLRDFSAISSVSMPLTIKLLKALENTSTPADSGIPGCPPTTIIVFGIVDSRMEPQNYTLHLGNARPAILKSKASESGFSPLLSHLLRPYSANPSRHVPVDKVWRRRANKLASRTVAVPIFVDEGDAEQCIQREQSEKAARDRDINNLLLRVCLGEKCGGLGGDLSRDIVFRVDPVEVETHASFDFSLMFPPAKRRVTSKKAEPSSILTVSEADSVAGIAIGLACHRSTSIDSRHIADAYNILKDRKQEWTAWETARQGKTPESPKADTLDEDPIVKQVREDHSLSSTETELLDCIVNPRELDTAFTDICIDYSVIESLQKVVSLPLLHSSYFKTGVLAKEAMGGALLYGPPGTGKTMICRYLAHTCKARMITIRPSDVTSKWVGDSEKRIASVFSLAARLAPCVVFIDEADALFSSRKDMTRSWERNMLTEFLQAMDGLTSAAKNKDKGVIVIGATNRPFDLDEAILRRLPCKILIDAPDTTARTKLLERYLKDNKLDAAVNLEEIAQRTDNYSGSDIKNLCVAAALASVKDAVGDNWDIPASSPTAEEELPAPIITQENVRRALNEVFPSLSAGNYHKLRSWGAGCNSY